MELEDAHHHRGQRAAGQAERQERDHGGAGRGVVGGLGRDHAFQRALAETLGVLDQRDRLAVAQESGKRGADAREQAGRRSRRRTSG